MALLGEYIFRLTCCALLCNIVLSFLHDGTIKSLIRMITGIFLTITAIYPLMDFSIPDLDSFDENYFLQGQSAAIVGEDYAQNSRREIIKSSLEAYILDKASMLGCDIAVQIELDEEGCPDGVTFSGAVTPDIRKKLESIITEDLGIAKEDQQWNG